MAALLVELIKVGGMHSSVKDLCEKILFDFPEDIEALTALQLYSGLDEKRQRVMDLYFTQTSYLLDLALIFEKIGRYEEMEGAAAEALQRWPGSFKAEYVLARALTLSGKVVQAEKGLGALSEIYPENYSVQMELATLSFLRGEYDTVLQFVDGPLAKGYYYPLMLLKARVLWAQNQKAQSIEFYTKVLQDGTVFDIGELSERFEVILPDMDLDRPFWEEMLDSPDDGYRKTLMDLVMAPSYFVNAATVGEIRFNQELSGWYMKYRWLKQFSQEMAARKAVKREEYYYAKNLYEGLIRKYPDDVALLYDLANIYGEIGEFGHEASIYDRLIAYDVEVAGLAEALTQNQLKQRPQFTLASARSAEEGRDDHIDIEKNWHKLCFWYTPRTHHETTLEFTRINYRAATWDDVVRANRIDAGYTATLFSSLSVMLSGGVESQDDTGKDTFLFGIEAEGKIGDTFEGSLSLSRDIVSDTTASLRRNLVRQELLAGVSVEPVYRLSLGGNYSIVDFSDNNWTTGYDLWTTYMLFPEPTSMKIFYKYDFKESNEGVSLEGALLADGFYADDHPYWAPKNYWANQFGLSFRHELNKEATLRSRAKYYTAEYYFGHDSGGNGFQGAKCGFFLEIVPELLLGAEGEIISSPVYRKNQYSLTANYRW